MEKQQVRVKVEKAATRCEICHQADLFDPITEDCLRCSNVEKALEANPQPITRSLWSPRFSVLEKPVQEQGAKWLFTFGSVALALIFFASQFWTGVIICSAIFIVLAINLLKQSYKNR